MKKTKLYRYVGRNGLITSPVLLDGINHIVYYDLLAENEKVLTNGERTCFAVTIPEEDLELWKEIDRIGQD